MDSVNAREDSFEKKLEKEWIEDSQSESESLSESQDVVVVAEYPSLNRTNKMAKSPNEPKSSEDEEGILSLTSANSSEDNELRGLAASPNVCEESTLESIAGDIFKKHRDSCRSQLAKKEKAIEKLQKKIEVLENVVTEKSEENEKLKKVIRLWIRAEENKEKVMEYLKNLVNCEEKDSVPVKKSRVDES